VTRLTLAVLVVTTAAAPAMAQAPGGSSRPASRSEGPVSFRAFADAGVEMFHAVEAFDAVFDGNAGTRFGAGLFISLPKGLFADVRVSRLQMTGERAFVFEGRRYSLGIRNTLKVIPMQVTGGIRTGRPGARAVPYVGAGAGWYRASETSAFAIAGETAERTTPGYHVVGGADVRLWRRVGVGAEVEWSQVSGGLAGSGIATTLDDTNLGGVSVRARVVVGAW
jgi:opacity protein-like surface antigen